MLTKRDPPFALQAHKYAATTVPSIQDWRGLWATWDTVTRGMIPNQELLSKPIKLRNACIFYIGHIPTFLDIQLNKSTGAPLCEPSHYPRIFERGVDPDVDNPEQCHAHSEIPDEYPPLGEILQYQQQVRKKVEELYSSGEATSSRKTGRGLWIGFEHEAMHLETLLYMLLQSDKKMPPPRTVTPDFESDAKVAEENSVPNEWFEIPQQTITVGLDDPEDNSGPDVPFGWDNEKPVRRVHVAKFKAQARAITNEEYGAYLDANKLTQLPASWVQVKNASTSGHSEAPDEDVRHSPVEHVGGISEHVNGNGAITPSSSYIDDKFIRTVYGLIPLRYALHWPVFASYNELAGYATWAGGRIPTADEVRSIYVHADHLRKEKAERQLG
jgi:formylglycine-generating enzyme required for sulfatase activity